MPRPIRSHAALRGIAALLVMFYHLSFGRDQAFFYAAVTGFFRHGYLWVDMFFVLSGFILSYVNRLAPGETYDRRGAAVFLVSRFARVYPLHILVLAAYVAAIAVLSVIADQTGRPSPGDWSAWSIQMAALQALLLNAWITDGATWNVPTWSISAEAVAYLLFPMLVNGLARAPRIATGAMAVATIGFFGYVAATTGSLDVIGGPFAILRCLAGFIAGVLTFRSRHLFAAWGAPLLSVIQIASVSGILLVLAIGTNDTIGIPLFVLLVGSTWEDRGALPRLLARRLLLWLGDVSYSVYLLHVPVIALLDYVWARVSGSVGLFGNAEQAVWLILVTLCVLALAHMTLRTVERPARQWLGRRWLGHRLPPIVAVPSAP